MAKKVKVKDSLNIYGIYHNNLCLYIGETKRDYELRWNEHRKELASGKHKNKTLTKYYTGNELTVDDLEFRLLYHLDMDNSLIRFFMEALVISLLNPKCNKIYCQSGFGRGVSFAKLKDKELCKKLIDIIVEYND